jgi:hypothetical protein
MKQIARLCRYVVLMVVVRKNSISWDITQCSPLKINRRFGGICPLQLQGRTSPACYLFYGGFLLGLFLNPEGERDIFLLNDY